MSSAASSPTIPFKRPPRKKRRDAPGISPSEMAAYFAAWEPLHQIAAGFPHWQRGDPGRPPDVPPAAVLLFACMIWCCRSERGVQNLFSHPPTWEPVRAALAARYPGYRGLDAGANPMDRSEYRRYRDAWGIDFDVLDEFRASFRSEMASLATGLGMFDHTKGSLSHPAVENMVTGDGTVLKPRFKAKLGDMQLDTITGALEQKPYDPDATWYQTGAGDRVRGVKFGFVEGWLPHEHERVILDVFPVETGQGADEASRALQSISHLKSHAPGITGVVWDMALRGTHIDALYQMDLLSVVKVAKVKGKPKSQFLGKIAARKSGNLIDMVAIYAINGAPHIREMVAGGEQFVRLEPQQTYKRRNKRSGWRWYINYTVPDAPPASQRLRGASLTLRLDGTPEDKRRGLNRAESLRPVAEGDADWQRLFAIRPGAESINRWAKERLRDSRAPAVGRPRQLFALLALALLNNLTALISHRQRRGLPPPPGMVAPPGSGPPGLPARPAA